MNKFLYFTLGCVGILALLFAIYLKQFGTHPIDSQTEHHEFIIMHAHHLLGFDLVDPEQAPLNIKDRVLKGYRLIMNTPFYAPNYAHDQLSCTNCHFLGGDTLGGKSNGISLVGAANLYPKYSVREGRVISLKERINLCFENSMNGKPLPENSAEMADIILYLQWISKEIRSLKSIPWLGLEPLKSQHHSNPDEGKQLYQIHCALCHGKEGEGGGYLAPMGKTIPPLWGANAFNERAGMNTLTKLAPFLYWNMPYQEPALTEEEALDIAAFILQQPHPINHFRNEK